MRISLWQQFSSNHSSSFVVVGRFATENEAENAAERLRQWMAEILWRKDTTGRTIEYEIEETYHLEWYPGGVSWDPNYVPEDIFNVVRRVRQEVFLMSSLTWDSEIPFTGLMWKIGAQKVCFSREDGPLYVGLTLECQAPNEEAAAAFCNETRDFLNGTSGLLSPPWGKDALGSFDLAAQGLICRRQQRVSMKLQFRNMGDNLYLLIKYFERNGFTNIYYDFEQSRLWTESDMKIIGLSFYKGCS